MKIDNPVTYTKGELDLVDNFIKRDKKNGTDWGDDKFKDIKLSIKNHYKVEQNYVCPYCAITYPVGHGMVWDIEHIVPKDKKVQFMFEPENLCVACKDCNGAKSSKEVLVNPDRRRFPNSSQDYKIIHPHFDFYHEHINAISPGDFYRPLSEKGEFTIVTCRLLRFYGVVKREQPEQDINDLAKALIDADGVARKILEDELVKRIVNKRNMD
ncbi:HNH endonuclease [Vibrio crassostreae]|uniref:HNH endonuclease n=1 Tax=Vibrio crassostreae TaxID=246167 RepID=UPI00104462C8|nr:HNH endonuclease [Vibrio crassostreae]TCN85089.1 HNH endonuclease [Vibrio crassostreae]CAK2405648.1 HNH endonuclease [Vibrio crassostreae]CAK3090708.1 HNH endonuclease [Vibrio crassostreae]CAK3629868.1 HNH endonuclease [Vibrio crassostreae]CAK3752006.1 HNH endonuclease [Vibrio crassostreae]